MRYCPIVAVMLLGACSSADKRQLGDICAKGDECASGRCDERVCKAADPLGPNAACVYPLQCRSEQCVDGACAVGVRQPGAPCGDPLQCASGQCGGGSAGHLVAERPIGNARRSATGVGIGMFA